MGIFATRSQRIGRRLPEGADHLREWFAGVGEALSTGGDGTVAGEVVGRRLAREGVDLGEALHGLRRSSIRATGKDPDFATVQALATAWADEMTGFVRRVSCADPLTGLGSPAHLQARLVEVLDAPEGGATDEGWALVVVGLASVEELRGDSLDRSWLVVHAADQIRLVFPGETVGRLTETRMAVLTRRTTDLGRRVALLRELLGSHGGDPHLWVEAVPSTGTGAAQLLDELARRE